LDDPEIQNLAQSIRDFGVKEPLVITLDGYILSGHRRYAAAKLAGLSHVPCRRENIRKDDPQFVVLLRECNRQRVKRIDEVLREEIVSANPDEAYAKLVQYRAEVAQIEVETGVIEGHTRRAEITDAKKPFLDAIERIIERLRAFWPLSDRLIHYQLLNDPPLIHASKPLSTYRNDQRSYKALTELLTRARVERIIPFGAIHDPTRPVTTWKVFPSPGPFIHEVLDGFLKGYYRDLQAPQPCHLEILGEKNTVGSIIRPVAMHYTIPYTLGRGYSSLPPRHAMAQRFRRSGKNRLLLLAMSDFDPEGEDIGHSFARSMRDDFGIHNIDFIKVALRANQVAELQLPPGPTAKVGSSRRKKFVREHGEHVYELEAVEPEQLQTMLRQVIESVLDMDLFRAELDRERQDAAYLDGVRKKVHEMLRSLRFE
jgi:ParB-like nuclease domain